MKVRIGSSEFKSQSVAKKHVQGVIEQYAGEHVGESSEHWSLINALWERSPSYVSGVLYFEVSRKFRGCAISSITCEGNIDWSVRSAVSGKTVNKWTMLTVAMRQAIRPQIQKFKAGCSRLCEICQSGSKLEIDHTVSFKSLMRGYLDQAGPSPDVYMYMHAGWMFRPEDREFEANWQQYHEERCSLRPLCVPCHQKCTLEARIGRPMIGYFDSSSGSEDV